MTPRLLHTKESPIKLTIAAGRLAKQGGQANLQWFLLLTKQASNLWQGSQSSTHSLAPLCLSSFLSSSHTALPFPCLAINASYIKLFTILKTCSYFLISFSFNGLSILLEFLIPPNIYLLKLYLKSHLYEILLLPTQAKVISPLNSKAFGLCFL